MLGLQFRGLVTSVPAVMSGVSMGAVAGMASGVIAGVASGAITGTAAAATKGVSTCTTTGVASGATTGVCSRGIAGVAVRATTGAVSVHSRVCVRWFHLGAPAPLTISTPESKAAPPPRRSASRTATASRRRWKALGPAASCGGFSTCADVDRSGGCGSGLTCGGCGMCASGCAAGVETSRTGGGDGAAVSIWSMDSSQRNSSGGSATAMLGERSPINSRGCD